VCWWLPPPGEVGRGPLVLCVAKPLYWRGLGRPSYLCSPLKKLKILQHG
jgi:hypothetical protein